VDRDYCSALLGAWILNKAVAVVRQEVGNKHWGLGGVAEWAQLEGVQLG
jgi:hypothetical protein